jgi:hypothetical protein
MRSRGFEYVCLSASVAIALVTTTKSLALDHEIPAAAVEIASPRIESAGLSGYARVLIHPLSVQYTTEFQSKAALRDHRVEGRDLEEIRRHYREMVTAKLDDAYPIASKPGPRVLRLEAVLLDHVLDKREWLVPTRILFRGAPKVQLIVFLRDSQTGAIIGRVGLDLRPHADRLMKESPGFYWHFMRRVFDRIATRVRWALEDSAETPS